MSNDHFILHPQVHDHLTPQHITVLGAGAFGFAIALLLTRAKHIVTLLDIETRRINHIRETGYNPDYLTDVKINDQAQNAATTDPAAAFTRDTKYIFFAIPIQFSYDYLLKIKPFITRQHLVDLDSTYTPAPVTIINLAKGVHLQRLEVMSSIFDAVFTESNPVINRCFMAGGSFAEEIAENLPTAFTVAAPDVEVAKDVAFLLQTDDNTVAQFSTDYIGLQVNGALKNCYAIFAGMATGLGYKSNTLCMLITMFLQETQRITAHVFKNGDASDCTTITGFSGSADFMLTCTGASRNRGCGQALAAGKTLEQVLAESKGVIEGVPTVAAMYKLLQKHNYLEQAPVLRCLNAVMYEGQSAKDAIKFIMSTPPHHESF